MSAEKCKIFSLTKHHLQTGDSSVDVVCLLEFLAERAKKGEILGVAIAFVEGNNEVQIGIADGCAHAGLLAGGVNALNFEINHRWSGR